MNAKKERREAAQKKAKKRKMAIMAVCGTSLILAIIAVIIFRVVRPDARVFAVPGGQSVVLYDNGRFAARLFHNVNISGTFIEDENGSVTTIAFTYDGITVSTQIENDVLILPIPWRATCRVHNHEIEFMRVQ